MGIQIMSVCVEKSYFAKCPGLQQICFYSTEEDSSGSGEGGGRGTQQDYRKPQNCTADTTYEVCIQYCGRHHKHIVLHTGNVIHEMINLVCDGYWVSPMINLRLVKGVFDLCWPQLEWHYSFVV